MINTKKPTNWHLTNEARDILTKFEKSKANMSAADTAPLAVSLIIHSKDKQHQNVIIEKQSTGKVHTGRYAEIPGIDSLGLAYSSAFKEPSTDKLWLNIEKAISAGICLLNEKYFDEDTGLIEWDKIDKDHIL
jgi:hypothetical protein